MGLLINLFLHLTIIFDLCKTKQIYLVCDSHIMSLDSNQNLIVLCEPCLLETQTLIFFLNPYIRIFLRVKKFGILHKSLTCTIQGCSGICLGYKISAYLLNFNVRCPAMFDIIEIIQSRSNLSLINIDLHKPCLSQKTINKIMTIITLNYPRVL